MNGRTAVAAADLASCQELCAANHTCTWIDWSLTAAEGYRCYISDSRIISEQQMLAQGVSHYRLQRGSDGYCGRQHVHTLRSILLAYHLHIVIASFSKGVLFSFSTAAASYMHAISSTMDGNHM